MTTSVRFGVELLDPCSFSRDSATAGGHVSLPFIPGGAILGLCAGAFHDKWSEPGAPVDAFTAFHSGALRFGDALPLAADGRVAYPAPRCWHEEKDGTSLINLSVAPPERDRQYKSLRAGFVAFDDGGAAPSWSRVSPVRETRLKTAINPVTGVAATGQLFGQQALATGQRFSFSVEADGPAAAALAPIRDYLTGSASGVHRIGRSRSAEYGRARFTLLSDERGLPVAHEERRTIIWCLSDVVPYQDWAGGALPPTLFGLDQGELDETRSFFGLRRHVPFNGRWRMRGSERLAIVAGSVLVFTGTHAVEGGERSIGLDRQAGFGRIIINPAVLQGAPPAIRERDDSPKPFAPPTPIPGALGTWMTNRAGSAARRENASAAVASAVDGVRWLLGNLKLFNAESLGADGYPGRSQWNAIRKAAQKGGSIQDLRRRLFEGDKPLVRRNDPQWRNYCRSGRTAYEQFDISILGDLAENSEDPCRTLALAIEQVLREFDSIMADQ
jgi:CRISPR-associated protein Csx10